MIRNLEFYLKFYSLSSARGSLKAYKDRFAIESILISKLWQEFKISFARICQKIMIMPIAPQNIPYNFQEKFIQRVTPIHERP